MNLKAWLAIAVSCAAWRSASAGPSSASCKDELPMEQIAADKAFASWENGTAVPYALNKYFMCQAVAKNGARACDALKPIAAQPASDKGRLPSSLASCRDFSGRALLSKALISHDPSFMKLCRKIGISSGEDHFSAADNETLCRIFLTHENDPDGGGAKAMAIHMKYRGHLPGESSTPCADQIRDYWGRGKGCSAEESATRFKAGAFDSDSCLFQQAALDYRKAFTAKDPDACGQDHLCRAMMGDGAKACEGYAKQADEAKKLACAGSPSSTPEAGK